jgi:cytochrome P450
MELALTPFSIGRRNCIGQNLAWRELYWAISTILSVGFHLRLGGETKTWEMDMDDRFNVAPKGKRLMLEVVPIEPKAIT